MRTVSNAAVQGMLSRETDKVFLVCVRIKHPSFATFYLVNDTQDLVRNDATYTAFPFVPIFPDEVEGQVPTAQIKFSNVDESIGKAIYAASGRGTVEMEVVLADTPNTVEIGPVTMLVSSATITATDITLNLSADDEFLNQQVPGQIYTPVNSPSVY